MKTTSMALLALAGLFVLGALSSCTTNIDPTPPVGATTTTTTESPATGTTTTRRTITTQY